MRRSFLTIQSVDLSACAREPIHIPGSIQPHGILLVVERNAGTVVHVAGDIETRLGIDDWQGADLPALIGEDAANAILGAHERQLRLVSPPAGAEVFDVTVHETGDTLLVELEPAGAPSTMAVLLPQLEAAAQSFDEARDLDALMQAAAAEFRLLTGFDRVMVYRFLDDDAGKVVAEETAPGKHSFLNHHFPASDIPAQARALYVRNLVRVIPDAGYTPAPLRPPRRESDPLDMSDCGLRSVSPIHLQYLHNMGVVASASVSIVRDGALWGLIACHNSEPKSLSADVRSSCRVLAGSLARQIKSREATDTYRERVRLRTFEDRIVELLLRGGSLGQAISRHVGEIQRMLDGDGVAVLRGSEIITSGECPPVDEIRSLVDRLLKKQDRPVFATDSLEKDLTLSDEARALAAGVLAMTLSPSEPWVVVWFRAEELEIVRWAGNPHKAASVSESGELTPRSSFEAWSETVRGRARRWTLPETEAADRLCTAITNVWQTRRIRDLNSELMKVIEQKEALVRQREFLLGEVNHRVQNSLQLVSSFLQMQARDISEPPAQHAIEEARRRIAAVALVHRRLYSAEQTRTIDAARYMEDLLDEIVSSLGDEWSGQLTRSIAPIQIPNDRAISLGLVLTELVINANKYAYDGAPGPIHVSLSENRNVLRLAVADSGRGMAGEHKGFGSRMLDAMVAQLGGQLDYADNRPGTRATLSAPIETPSG